MDLAHRRKYERQAGPMVKLTSRCRFLGRADCTAFGPVMSRGLTRAVVHP